MDWFFNPDFRACEAEQLFGSLQSTFEVRGERIAKAPLSTVERVSADGTRYYVKRYVGNGKNAVRRWFGLRGLIAPQRVVKEWENLLLFSKWRIPTAIVVAYGLERERGSFVRGALVTQEIPETTDMARMALAGDQRLRDRRWVAQVLRQVAAYTRRLHDEHFVHNDLKWRNLLVDEGAPPAVFLIDCPSGGFWRGPMLRYRIVKDLACLDKVAKYQLSRTQRLRFYLDYTGHSRLSAADKRRICKVLDFFEGRE
ncbi:MAG: heptose kinase [Betaproteobacteria bacterium]|nr:heptose kinase [Betaproteobacteria bacterium]